MSQNKNLHLPEQKNLLSNSAAPAREKEIVKKPETVLAENSGKSKLNEFLTKNNFGKKAAPSGESKNRKNVFSSSAGKKQPAEITEITPAQAMANALIENMASLISVMEQENDLLAAQDFMGIEAIKSLKSRLAVNHQANLKSLAAEPALLKEMTDIERKKLKEIGQILQVVSQKNAIALQAGMRITEVMLQNIVSLVRKEVLTKPAYADPRQSQLASGLHSPTCPPVAINRTA